MLEHPQKNTIPQKTPMKTKHILSILAIGAVAIGAVTCVADTLERPKAQITFVVKDDFGKPIPNMVVGMSTFHHWEPGGEWGTDIDKKYEGKTNADGIVTLTGEGTSLLFNYYTLNRDTHYKIGRQRVLFKEKKNGRWEPWNPTVEIECKPIIKPIAMYFGEKWNAFPEREKEFGFDLTTNDWVSPYGKGIQTDMIFKLETKVPYVKSSAPFDFRLKITFPNEGDGIQSWYGPHENSGLLAMPRYAPTDGYVNSLELKMGCDEKGFWKERDDQNYFFRIRSVTDKDGKIKSCLYGKISGNIQFDVRHEKVGVVGFNYFLNPTPLDVNMEHNYEKNLRALPNK
jgi:hypothetical protein